MTTRYHVPVLPDATVDLWITREDGLYADGTFGGGGHSAKALERLDGNGRIFAFDQDPDARANVPDDARLTFVARNFAEMAAAGLPLLDGILLDLGVSSHQFDVAARGFSYRFHSPLDMRMNPEASVASAADLLNRLSTQELADVFYRYGELRQSRKLARAIAENRPVLTTFQLNAVVEPLLDPADLNGDMARVYQALRIRVNDEIGVLCRFLTFAPRLLKPGGRLVVLAYHSLEDGLVKKFFRAGNETGVAEKDFYGREKKVWRELTQKPVVADAKEIFDNPRARSARLRAAETI